MFGGFEGGFEDAVPLPGDDYDYTGGWDPSAIMAAVPKTIYHRKNGKPYMNFKDWADTEYKGRDDDRDKELRGVYMSARMMKYHPQMTKELRKTYGLLASAALRAMTPAGKF